jgi:DNA-binding response OmpR family regulator
MAEGNFEKSNFRLLIADEDTLGSRYFADFLRERGFVVDHITTGKTVKEYIKLNQPDFVICDLMLSEFNAPQLLSFLRDPAYDGPKPKVLVTSAHNIIKNIKECITLGASDYVIKPFKHDDLLTRLIFHIQNRRDLSSLAKKKVTDEQDIHLHLLDIIMREALSGRESEEVLFNISKMIAMTLKAVRCSTVIISEDLQRGEVLASSDNKSAKGLALDMNKYPEMLHVVTTGKSVIIEDLASDPMLAKIKDKIKGISFNSMIVSPLFRNNQTCGVISARMEKTHSKFNDRDIRFVQLVAQVVSLTLGSSVNFPHEILSIIRGEKAS